jgi:hypothetical protein
LNIRKENTDAVIPDKRPKRAALKRTGMRYNNAALEVDKYIRSKLRIKLNRITIPIAVDIL